MVFLTKYIEIKKKKNNKAVKVDKFRDDFNEPSSVMSIRTKRMS